MTKKKTKAKPKTKKPKKTYSQELLKDVFKYLPQDETWVWEDDDDCCDCEPDLTKENVADNVRLIDSMNGCVYPEIYESFNNGEKIVTTLGNESNQKIFEMWSDGNGISYKDSNDVERRIDYATLSYLVRGSQIMDSIVRTKINGDGWWVGYSGFVGSFEKVLQNLKEKYKNK